jgi:hypothetical protein
VVDALGGGPLVSTWQAAKLRRIANGEFSAQFALSLALKDVHLALQAAGGDRFAALACLLPEGHQARGKPSPGEISGGDHSGMDEHWRPTPLLALRFRARPSPLLSMPRSWRARRSWSQQPNRAAAHPGS